MAGVGGSRHLPIFGPKHPISSRPHSWRRIPMVFRKSLPILFALSAFCAITLNARADIPTDPAVRAKIVGTPKSLLVHPPSFTLSGSRATAQPVVTGVYGDGTVRDLTHFADLKIEG